MTEPAAPSPASEALIYGVPVAALIAVLGVLVIGLLQAGVNRQLHKERLKREAINDRRQAWENYLTTWHEKPGYELRAKTASEEFKRLKTIVDNSKATSDSYQLLLNKTLEQQALVLEAMKERDLWQSRFMAQQMTAIATVSDVRSPLLLIPDLSGIPQDEQTVDISMMMIEAMRADQIMSDRKRKKAEEAVREKVTTFMVDRKLAPVREQVALAQRLEAARRESPSGAGHHGTDNESTSDTEGEEDASIDNDEPGSSPGDR